MDRSFLLRQEVVEASRDFICIRLATYEDKEEVDYLTQVFRGGARTTRTLPEYGMRSIK